MAKKNANAYMDGQDLMETGLNANRETEGSGDKS